MKKKDKPPPCIGCDEKFTGFITKHFPNRVELTQEEFDALETRDPNVLYTIIGRTNNGVETQG